MEEQRFESDVEKAVSIHDLEKREALRLRYENLVRLMKAAKIMNDCSSKADMYKQLADQFLVISDYENSKELSEKCWALAKKTKKRVKKQIYEEAQNKKNKAKQAQDYYLAAQEFRRLKGYMDSEAMAVECEELGRTLSKKKTIKKLTAYVLIAVCFAAVLIFFNTSFAKYQTAGFFKTAGYYHTAIDMYKKLDHYKASEQKLVQCQYLWGVKLKNTGEYKKAESAFAAAGGYKDSTEQIAVMEKLVIKNGKPGDVVNIGDNDWVILEIADNRALLLLKSALNGRAYNDSQTDVTWETSTLRQWLNSGFMEDNFSEAERKNILLSNVKNDDNLLYGTMGGNDTQDYIFMLSISEALNYQDLLPGMKSNSWLRSPGYRQSCAAFLSVDKRVMDYGYAVDSDSLDVRPAMWFGLE